MERKRGREDQRMKRKKSKESRDGGRERLPGNIRKFCFLKLNE